MITQYSLQILKDLKEAGKTIDEAITMGESLLSLQRVREELCRGLYYMNEYAQSKIREGKYDDFLGDTNGLIDKVQGDMEAEKQAEIDAEIDRQAEAERIEAERVMEEDNITTESEVVTEEEII